jgi:hypothetical protein
MSTVVICLYIVLGISLIIILLALRAISGKGDFDEQ